MAGGAVISTKDGSSRGHLYTGRTTFAVCFLALVAASAGLLFGYDIGVTGGVISQFDFQQRFFPDVLSAGPSSNAYCKFDDQLLQLFTSSLFLAGAVSSMIGMVTCKKLGRKWTMMMGGVSFIIGVVLVSSAYNIAQLVIGRICLGIGVGFANQATPLYLVELAPFRLRGALNLLFQLATTIGIFAAQLINYGTQHINPWGWRLSLGLAGVPAVFFTLGSLFLPDTPNSLVQRGKPEEGLRVLRRIRGVDNVDVEFEDITRAANAAAALPNPYTTILKRRYRPQLVITCLIPLFQQFTGINAIMFYAPQLFATIGSGDAALLNTVIIGAVNVAATFIAILVVDRLGRKALFLEGGIQMIIGEVIVGSLILAGMGKSGNGVLSHSMANAIIAFVCIYVAAFAWSWGPLGWLVPSEISPIEVRAAGSAINTCVNFLMSFLIGQVFLTMLCSMKFGVFYFFAGFVLIMTLFVMLFVPETKNVPIEEIEENRIGRHWFWSKIVRGTIPPPMPVSYPNGGMPVGGLAYDEKGKVIASSNGASTGTSSPSSPRSVGSPVVNGLGQGRAVQMAAPPGAVPPGTVRF